MKATKTMRGMGLMIAALMVVACHNDNLPPRLSKAQKQEYGTKLAGTYGGEYNIIYTLNKQDSLFGKKIKEATMSITDYDMQGIFFHDFPVSLLSHIVQDPDLSKALADVPNQDISARYDFKYYTDYVSTLMSFEPVPVALTLDYGGATHHIIIRLGNNWRNYLFQPEHWTQQRPLLSAQWQLVFEFMAIYDGDRLVQEFSYGNYDAYGMFVVFKIDDANDQP